MSQRNQSQNQEDEQQSKKNFKLLIEFDVLAFDVSDFKRSEFDTAYNEVREGLDYLIILHFYSFPYSRKLAYNSEEERKNKFELLKQKFLDLGVIVQ